MGLSIRPERPLTGASPFGHDERCGGAALKQVRVYLTSGERLDLELVEHGERVAAPEGFASLRGPEGMHVFVRRSAVAGFTLEAARPEEIAAEIRSLGFVGPEL